MALHAKQDHGKITSIRMYIGRMSRRLAEIQAAMLDHGDMGSSRKSATRISSLYIGFLKAVAL